MRFILITTLFIFSSSVLAMSKDCAIASKIFDDSGAIIAEGMEMAINDGEKLKNTTVTYDEFSAWYKHVYPKKISKVAKKYDEYKNSPTDNPIYLGITSILEANNFMKALDNFMLSKDEADRKLIIESRDRLSKSHARLVEDCGK